MALTIRRARDADVDALVEVTLSAFVPIFESFRGILGPEVFPLIWPDWRKSQREAVETLLSDASRSVVLVADLDGAPVGFAAYEIRSSGEAGEVLLVAVSPEHQNRGIGTRLNEQALEEMRAAGVRLAVVEAGGESSHAQARRSYEKSGYVALPIVRYFRSL